EAHRRLNRLLHHFAELAGGLDLTLAGDGHRFDRQQLAADLGPRETGNSTDLILFLAHPITEFSDAEEIAKIVQRQLDLFSLTFEDLTERLARDLGQLALERADAGFARVMLNHL